MNIGTMLDVIGFWANWPQSQTAKRKKNEQTRIERADDAKITLTHGERGNPIPGAGARLLRGGDCRLRSAGQHRSDLLMVAYGNLTLLGFRHRRVTLPAMRCHISKDRSAHTWR
jgi:hypothetical protein